MKLNWWTRAEFNRLHVLMFVALGVGTTIDCFYSVRIGAGIIIFGYSVWLLSQMLKKELAWQSPIPSVRAKGVPQHVIDKLDLPPLPRGFYYKIYDEFNTIGRAKIKRRGWLLRHTVVNAKFCYKESFDAEWLASRYSRACKYLHEQAMHEHTNRIALKEFWS